ncbi:Dolichyl-phosphate-mannose--protein mannosyltransferase 4, partial [Coemansia helicoidea]
SNAGRYPLRYEDQRVSSQGQQVTGAKALSDGGFWRIKPAADADEFAPFLARRLAGEAIPSEELDRWAVHNLDQVQLEHVTTGTNLRTHDVASPMTATNMEITTLALNDTASAADTVWQIQVDGAKSNTTRLQTSSSFIRIVSDKHGVAVWTHKKALPAWGHAHQEINGIKKPSEKSTLWTVPQIRGREATAEEQAEMRNKVPRLGFFAKFAELQGLMVRHNNALTSVHPFQSSPISWPLMIRGISFWTSSPDRRQIYLMGNPVGWWMADAALLGYATLMVGMALLARRNVHLIDGIVHRHMTRSTGFIAAAWALHYFPFFLMGRSLFLHHYLPAAIFAYMMLAAVFQILTTNDYQRFALRHWDGRARALLPSAAATAAFVAIAAAHIATFVHFAPISYGSRTLSPAEVAQRRWMGSYDLHFQK